jgi:hypothetical protein
VNQELSALTENLPPLSFIRPYISSIPLGAVIVILLLPP